MFLGLSALNFYLKSDVHVRRRSLPSIELRRNHPSRDESADPVAPSHGEQQVRRVVAVMVDGDARTRLQRHVARADAVQMMRRRIAIVTGDADGQAMAGPKPDAVRTDLDLKLIDLVGRERLASIVGVIRRPGQRAVDIYPALRASEPAARQ